MIQNTPKQISAHDLNIWLLNDSCQLTVIDVREDEELSIAPFPDPVIHLPLSKASLWISKIPQKISLSGPVVVVCHSGQRSWDFGNWLIQQKFGYEVWNLEGGIDSWSVNVDPSISRY